MKHSEYVKVVKSLAQDSIQKVLLRVALKKLPFLAMGPMAGLTSRLITWLVSEGIEEAELRIFYTYVDFRTEVQGKAFEEAMLHNYNMQLTGDEDDKRIAEERLKKAMLDLLMLSR